MDDQIRKHDDLVNFTFPTTLKTLSDLRSAFQAYHEGYKTLVEGYREDQVKEITKDYQTSNEKTRRTIHATSKIFEEYGNDGLPLLEMLQDLGNEREQTISTYQKAEMDFASSWKKEMLDAHDKDFLDLHLETVRGLTSNPMYDVPSKFKAFTNSQNLALRKGITEVAKFKMKLMVERGEKRDVVVKAFSELASEEMEKIHRRLALEKPERLFNVYQEESSKRSEGVSEGVIVRRPYDPFAEKAFGRSQIAAQALNKIRELKKKPSTAE